MLSTNSALTCQGVQSKGLEQIETLPRVNGYGPSAGIILHQALLNGLLACSQGIRNIGEEDHSVPREAPASPQMPAG